MDYKVIHMLNAYAVQMADKNNLTRLADHLDAAEEINVLEIRWNLSAKIGMVILICHKKGINAKEYIEELTAKFFNHGI